MERKNAMEATSKERERIRVLHMMPNYGTGGAERVAYYILKNLDRTRFEPATLSLFGPTGAELEVRLAEEGIPCTYLDKKLGFDPRMFSKIHRVVRQFRPHVVHTHRAMLPYALPALLVHPVPVKVHTVHNLADRELGRAGRWVHHLAFRLGVRPVSIAREVTRSLENVYGSLPYHLIPNGIPVQEYRQACTPRCVWREREHIPGHRPVLVNVARINKQKNHKLLIDSFAEILREVPEAILLLIGDGPLRPEVERQAQSIESGSGDSVRFLGLREDVADALGASDLFVLSSDWEGHPLVVMEAMAAGLPVVSTAVGGVPELVEAGKSGVLVEAGDRDGLAQAVVHLIKHPEARDAMGQEAGRRAEQRFDVSVMADAYAALYESALRGR